MIVIVIDRRGGEDFVSCLSGFRVIEGVHGLIETVETVCDGVN